MRSTSRVWTVPTLQDRASSGEVIVLAVDPGGVTLRGALEGRAGFPRDEAAEFANAAVELVTRHVVGDPASHRPRQPGTARRRARSRSDSSIRSGIQDWPAAVVSDGGPSSSGGPTEMGVSSECITRRFSQEFKDELCLEVITASKTIKEVPVAYSVGRET